MTFEQKVNVIFWSSIFAIILGFALCVLASMITATWRYIVGGCT